MIPLDTHAQGVRIILHRADGDRTLTEIESALVLQSFEEIARQARKWQAMLRTSTGRLLIFDPALVESVVALLDNDPDENP